MLQLISYFFLFLDVTPALITSDTLQDCEDHGSSSWDSYLKDSILWAVPRNRRSREKRVTRKFNIQITSKAEMLPKNNIIMCQECGSWHERSTICGK